VQLEQLVVSGRKLVEVEQIPFPDVREVVTEIIAYLVQRKFSIVVAKAELTRASVDSMDSIALVTKTLVVEILVQNVQVNLQCRFFLEST